MPTGKGRHINEAIGKSILIFSDGACSGNPGPGGWGAIVVTPEGTVRELGGSEHSTTNNRMELTGAIMALRAIEDSPPGAVDFYTDSTYVIRGITQWIWGWRKRDWKNAEGEDVLNRDLWEALSRTVSAREKKSKVHWHYVRGHRGTPGNERCDEIAVEFSKNKWVDLYCGPLIKYSVPIYDLPEDEPLPEMKPKAEKVKPYSYLSLVHGEVWRHNDWPSCERRVKGQTNAKFKKAMRPEDEKSILTEWNVPSSTVIHEKK